MQLSKLLELINKIEDEMDGIVGDLSILCEDVAEARYALEDYDEHGCFEAEDGVEEEEYEEDGDECCCECCGTPFNELGNPIKSVIVSD